MFRAPDDLHRRVAAAFRDWGIPTVESIQMVKRAAPQLPVIASGGLRSGIDIAKAIALGAEMGGMAGPFLKAATVSTEKVAETLEETIRVLRIAMFAAGAGVIGGDARYTKCSFRSGGTGTFQCGPDSRPTIGERGRFERVEEIKLETIVATGKLAGVVKAMLAAHSYEEVAYDIVPLRDPPVSTGLGRYGELATAVAVGRRGR